MTKRALILGIGGQDGSYLADILLAKGYEVHGMHRRSSVDNLGRIAHCADRLTLHRGDLVDGASVERIVREVHPAEIYNEADQDSVGWSRSVPELTWAVTFAAVARLLETVRRCMGTNPLIRLFQPLSAHVFGDPSTLTAPAPQDELTPLNPQSPYGIAKAAAWHACRMYRERHGVHVSCGILYNHDSPRRSDHYLLHKLCKASVRIAKGRQRTVALGNLDARVDVGFARDYMEAAWLLLQQPTPSDRVIATEEAEPVLNMAIHAMASAGVSKGRTLADLVTRDPEFWQEAPPSFFQGNAAKMRELGWCPKVSVWGLIDMLVRHFREQET